MKTWYDECMNTDRSTFENVASQMVHLTSDEKTKLYNLLSQDLQRANAAAVTEDDVNQSLLARGIYSYVPPVRGENPAADVWKPVDSEGPRISERIISERR
jgi:hypothetical protein